MRCRLLTSGSAADPQGFLEWKLANGNPEYLGYSNKWVVVGTAASGPPRTVGWSLTEEGEIWSRSRGLTPSRNVLK